ncbi:MAG: Acyl carrier protein [Candidatus Thorarchaeota archaeon AB_25]|nr:MAG: Acyl carrier protein [Candidatus Thorarchaeota archaeon AB_25]
MTDFENKLLEILSKVLLLDTDKITDDIRRKDFEPWDSMAHLVIVSEIENEFEIFFEDEEVIELWTVGDIKKVLATKLSS